MRLLVTIRLILWVLTPGVAADTTINSIRKYAWGANTGWSNFAANTTQGTVFGEAYLEGYVWSANAGWINLGMGTPEDGIRWSNTNGSDSGLNHDGRGNLSGLAWGAAIGWINFGWATIDDANRPRVNLLTGEFSGFAYSAATGWIKLGTGRLSTDRMICYDTDYDGMDDSWEVENFGDLTTADATTDQDQDTVLDKDEYLGATDPNDLKSFFRVINHEGFPTGVDTEQIMLEFTTSPRRLYQIQVSSDLKTYVDSGLGVFEASSGSTTSKTFIGSLPDGRFYYFYRAGALKPLQ